MLNQMKKRANKSYITVAVILALVAIVLLAITKLGFVKLLQGPTPLNGASIASMEGEYVTVEVKYPLEIYEEDYEENTDTHQKRTTDYGYVVLDPDSEEFYGVILGKARADEMEKAMEQAYAYLTYESDEDVKDTVIITGTVKEMDSQSRGFFNQTMAYLFDGYEDVSSAFYIDDSTVNGQDILFVVIFSAIAAGCILFMIIQFIMMATGSYQKYVRAYLKKHPQETMDQLEAEFGMAAQAYSNGWVGQKHIFVISGRKSFIIDNMDVVWCYYYHRSGRYSVSQLRYYTMDRKMKSIDMAKSEAMALMECFENRLPHIVLGYDKDYEKQIRKDFAGFLNLKYNPAKNAYDNAAAYGTDAYGNMGNAYGADAYGSTDNAYGADDYGSTGNGYGTDTYGSDAYGNNQDNSNMQG